MNRKAFLSSAGTIVGGLFMNHTFISVKKIKPEEFIFNDDGKIPNSKYSLLIYHGAFTEKGNKAAEWLEDVFSQHNWTNSWRWGVYSYHHYHSNTHEVLGVYSGNAILQLGGEKGQKFKVKPGDIIVIPAGTGHKNIGCSSDFSVVGAYPNGMQPDLMKGEPGERPSADKNISKVPFPDSDPLLGADEGLCRIWK
jgi:uncharacterized protein YjlB